MGKIKQRIVESKARKRLGEEKYYELRQQFLDVFNSVCSELLLDKEGRQIVRELRGLKSSMWIENLLKILGSAMFAVSVWRWGDYTLRESIAGCAVGVIMTTVAQLRNLHTKACYDDTKDELIDYIAGKVNNEDNELNGTISQLDLDDDNARIAYKDACDDLAQY